MAPSRSRSAAGDEVSRSGAAAAASAHKSLYNAGTGSSAPPGRLTRSQSREVERRASHGGDNGGGWKGWSKDEKLGAIEESPVSTPQRRVSSRVAPGSPEDAANMSGTTILPEPETDLDPEMMIETLPSLEREAKGVLNILVPGSVDPVSIVGTAKKLRDPQNPHRKRLKRFMSNLDAEAQYFGNQTYIDAKQVSQLLVPALAQRAVGTSKDWSPDPILHKTNCARFALDVLLADVSNLQKTDSQRKAINDLEGRFPSPFMNGLDKDQDGPGQSTLEKDTFELALEIRTQSLLIKLEMHQNDAKFDPEAIVNGVFFDDIMADEEDSYEDVQAPLRGFDIGALEDENGRLPERFREAVYDRINEIRVTLAEEDDDGTFDIGELQGVYRWQNFVLRATQWVRKRDDEIDRESQSQADAEVARDDFFLEETPQPERQGSKLSSAAPKSLAGMKGAAPVSPVQTVPQQTATKSAAKSVKDGERRKSSKSPWLNLAMVQRLNERSQSRRQTDFVQPAQRVERSPGGDRRQTLSGPTASAAPPERREIPASPEGSPTLLQEDDIFGGFHLQPTGRDHAPEKSHSPPMRRTAPVQRTRDALAGSPSSKDILNAIIRDSTPTRDLEPRQKSLAAFVDRQEHAHRVSPISLESRSVERPQPSRKRAFEDDDENDDDDEEFTRYERAIDPSIKRAQKPDHPRHKKRRRIDETGQPASAPLRGNTPPPPSPPPRLPQPQPQPQPQPRHSTSPARGGSSVPEPRITSETKARTRWLPAEDRRLMRLIRECGTGWSDLVRQNHAQPVREDEVRIEDRDQVQYKDRARNLKIIYYREGRQNELPGQFHYVTMSERDKNTLRRRGIQID